jgi:hypothetical protein
MGPACRPQAFEFGQFQGKGQQPLLTLRSVMSRGATVDHELELVSMRTVGRLSPSEVCIAALRKLALELVGRLAAAGPVPCFEPRAGRRQTVVDRSQGSQKFVGGTRTDTGESAAVLGHDPFERFDSSGVNAALFQKVLPLS